MLHTGARQLPLRHLTIRVPWHDTGWTGCVCQNPADNTHCLILKNIAEKRNQPGQDALETRLAAKSWQELEQDQWPPCASERGGFMAPYARERTITHPYSAFGKAHQHFAPTPLRLSPYSEACIPFAWVLTNDGMVERKVQELALGYDQAAEERANRDIGRNTSWVQTKHNQLVMFETFWSAVRLQESLCFFYAKATPLVEDTRRVIIGVGRVQHVGGPIEYRYSGPGPLQSMLWEREVQHSIRPDFCDGFLLPYHEVLAYLREHPELEPADYVAFAPDDQFESFSFATEHLTNDGAIGSLLACIRALENIKQHIEGPWDRVLAWIDARINELWAMRGPCPGLGSALTAFGIEKGTLLAYELESILAQEPPERRNPWPLVERLMSDPRALRPGVTVSVGETVRKKWAMLPAERKALLKLLSRLALTAEQATRYYVHEDSKRIELHIGATDEEILANPYLLYELDWMAEKPIQVSIVDRGLFPDPMIREQYPLPEPSNVDDATDPRRVRAFVVARLREAEGLGDTLRPRSSIIREIRELAVQPPCPVDTDLMNVVEAEMGPIIRVVEMADGEPAYQLSRLGEMSELIRTQVLRRKQGRRHEADVDWRKLLDEALPAAGEGDELEERARQEKAAALEELFASRVSVLAGPAGTGKTFLLKVLCQHPLVAKGGVLLLAPTGKARVQMERATGLTAQTIAQFLYDKDRYYAPTGVYRLSDRAKVQTGRTVVIDESSMVTEPQLAAVLDAVQSMDRLILVGDERQLPPIGAGRPFLDIVRQLAPADVDTTFPRVGPGYAELTVIRRQISQDGDHSAAGQRQEEPRDDLTLASWFSGRPVQADADSIWAALALGEDAETLQLIRWNTPDELQHKLMQVLVRELRLQGPDDWQGFGQSIGGTLVRNYVYYNAKRGDQRGAGERVEEWQILSPVHNLSHGVDTLNRLIQQTFRRNILELANQRNNNKICRPMGPQGIVYGDKVINVRNHRRTDVFPNNNALAYIANGEIGSVVGQFRGQNAKYQRPWKLEVEFSTQPGEKYGFTANDFGEEGEPYLELAYALTIHKAQGSEFGLTIVILPEPCRLLSRELLYTALTRQVRRVVILHQGEVHDLKRYADEYYSESARRLTNLFGPPELVQVQDRFLDRHLIHTTQRGELVRSKSEVIIANLLYNKGLDYQYEAPLRSLQGEVRYPDFTIVDDASGLTFYWEHLGMLGDVGYRRRWQEKLEWYRAQGILPHEAGGGPSGTLLVSEDDPEGGINSKAIEELVDSVLLANDGY